MGEGRERQKPNFNIKQMQSSPVTHLALTLDVFGLISFTEEELGLV